MRDTSNMVQQGVSCLRLLVMKLLLLSLSCDTAAVPYKAGTYTHTSLQEVMDIPLEGVMQVCVVPLNDNTRLKVRYTDAAGWRQELVIRKKSLSAETLVVLNIEVEAGAADKGVLSVRINGTQLQPPEKGLRPLIPTPPTPRITLFLKGNARVTDCIADTATYLRMIAVTEGNDGVTEGHGGEVTEGHGGKGVSSLNASVTPPPSSASTNVTAETEDPESGQEEPWWSFLLVLGKVGEVPVLVLLVACLLVGLIVGSILVCLCTKPCRKRRVEYVPVSTRRSHTGHLAGDIVRDNKFWDTLSSRQRSSGIGSAYSTLNTDNGSHMGTTNSRGAGMRLPGSANNSMDRSMRVATPLGVNNLGRGMSGSPSNSTRSRNNSLGNVLNIPHGTGVTRSNSGRSTGSWDNRKVEGSPMLAQGGGVARTASNRSTGSSINRNTNRSPNIPYTKKLGILAGHQDTPKLQKPVNTHHDPDDDSDDSCYDKPYVSPPIVPDNYSVPHVGAAQPLILELRNLTSSSNDPAARQVPVYEFGTFKK